MAMLYFPEAMNQGPATLYELVNREAIILCACAFIGLLGYCLCMMALGVYAVLAHHRFSEVHRASMAVA